METAVVNAPHNIYPIQHVLPVSIHRTIVHANVTISMMQMGGLRMLEKYDAYIMVVRLPTINVATKMYMNVGVHIICMYVLYITTPLDYTRFYGRHTQW